MEAEIMHIEWFAGGNMANCMYENFSHLPMQANPSVTDVLVCCDASEGVSCMHGGHLGSKAFFL